MRTFRESLNERLEKESFRKEYDAIRPEMDILCASAEADRVRHLPEKERGSFGEVHSAGS